MAKELVAIARKTAVLRGQTIEDYVLPILEECAGQAAADIGADGPLVLRERADKLSHLTYKKNLGTLNLVGQAPTRLASLAGQCLTSVAKLIDPYFRKIIEANYSAALHREFSNVWPVLSHRFTLPLFSVSGDSKTLLCEAGRFDFLDIFDPNAAMLRVPGEPSDGIRLMPGDSVCIRRGVPPSAGDTVVVVVGGKVVLKDVRNSVGGLLLHPRTGRSRPVRVEAEPGLVGVLAFVLRASQPTG
ncbi:hypothetical protein [Urbifossiella limnaea]|uniref:hypothetical protein n=1 Tax=Urbifossiella limnaea TaxID=2528023 RepID=UPI00119D4ACA|nr:hypothetical protein [Urbifossiella limnaea]